MPLDEGSPIMNNRVYFIEFLVVVTLINKLFLAIKLCKRGIEPEFIIFLFAFARFRFSLIFLINYIDPKGNISGSMVRLRDFNHPTIK